MAMVPEVSLDSWKALYEAMARFGGMRPWEMFSDSEVIGIENPSTGEMGYACVLGELGEVFALCVYRGTEGYDVHKRITEGSLDSENEEVFALQNCLIAELSEKEFLKQEDLAIAKKLDVKARPGKSWPLFRSHVPGHLPWFVNEDEAVYLTFALQAASDALRRLEKVEFDPSERPGHVFSYFMRKGKMEAEWRPTPVHRKMPPGPLQIDQQRIERIKNAKIMIDSPWEADKFAMPTPIMDRERPYFPDMYMLVHAASGFILDGSAISPEDPIDQALANGILTSIEKHGRLPSEVHFKDEKLRTALSPLGKALDIRLEIKTRLNGIDQAKRGMKSFFRRKD